MPRVVLSLFLFAVAALTAAPVTLEATMTPGQEVPVPDIPAGFSPSGFATSTFDWDMGTLSAFLSWEDMTSNVVAAHIHRRTPGSPTGPPVVGFFMGVSLPQTDTFDSGVINLTAVQVQALRDGLYDGTLYYNVHTVRNPPGEIRGDIEAIPEPSTLVLLISGGALLMLGRRRLAR